jgi:putative transposase
MLDYKMKILGRCMVKVDPKYTSQICSSCGETVKKSLSVRTHKCPECGLVMDRDENAALNILSRGRECLAARVGCRASL